VQRLERLWSGRSVRLVYHEDYRYALPGVPLDPRRAERVLAFLDEEGLLEPGDLSVPRRPSVRNLLRVHSPEYLDSLQRRETAERIFGLAPSDEELERAIEMQRLWVGGTIQATRLALGTRGVAVNLGGGLHHARRDTGAGFCLFNDIAVAITRLRARGFREPVLVVDLDYHDGDGTRTIFANDPSVWTYSVHAEHWEEPDAIAATAIALGHGVTDEVYLGTLLKTLPDVIERVKPGLAVYLAGVDPAEGDPLGTWHVTPAGLLSRDRFVVGQLRHRTRPVPMAVVLGGGYGDRAWAPTARFLAWLLTGRAIEPPGNDELTLQRFRRLWRSLDPHALTSEPGDFSWRLTEEDLVGIMPGAPRETRFLRYFSRHGVELVLERFGICDQLRLRGFAHPTVDIETGHSLGQTLRIFSDADRAELLVELRVNRTHHAVPGLDLVVVEWLLLQDPRAEFGPYRRPLPGQQHPGLGMLSQLLGWLVVVCEMLSLDGIFFTASHFHIAAQSRRLVRFLEPEHEAAFRAVAAAVSGLPLAEASRAVDGGEVLTAEGSPFRWQAYPQVLPVSDRLKERVFGEHYEARVAEELSRLDLRFDGDAHRVGAGASRGRP
jgi:acetoin utilization deacetylase AcuC-like enzyme